MQEHEKCRSCSAPIIWANNATTGRAGPIDANPAPDGNCVFNTDGTYAVLPKDLFASDDRPRHKNHFATCPNSRSHKKAK